MLFYIWITKLQTFPTYWKKRHFCAVLLIKNLCVKIQKCTYTMRNFCFKEDCITFIMSTQVDIIPTQCGLYKDHSYNNTTWNTTYSLWLESSKKLPIGYYITFCPGSFSSNLQPYPHGSFSSNLQPFSLARLVFHLCLLGLRYSSHCFMVDRS